MDRQQKAEGHGAKTQRVGVTADALDIRKKKAINIEAKKVVGKKV